MNDASHIIRNWHIRITTVDGPLRYHVEARNDTYQKYHDAYRNDIADGLSVVADKAGIDREELLILFGHEP